jgi:YgiT-type zinc finger domain-containing protein
MPMNRECPLCGGTMTVHESESVTRIPGNPNATLQVTKEWVCPDCEYFEEVDENT